MIMKLSLIRVVWLVFLILFVGSLGWLLLSQRPNRSVPDSPKTIQINGQSWYILERADTKEKRAQGLGDRASLERGTGMLFVFPTEDRYGFWMKGMQFPLDIIFIRQGVVDSVARNRLPGDLTPVFPHQPVDHVLEVNAGEGATIAPGQQVTW
ncbi:MAG: DUF192 domain-containing protein [Candidatus Moraniibacteriota bacterium]|nr:MAG: DUF192 domain-containing protein [Candidatus Moranbacteria bacterium]